MMKTIHFASILSCLLLAYTHAQDFKQFPGAVLDEKAGRASSRDGVDCKVYTTSASFDKVYAFYSAIHPAFPWRVPAPRLPSGKEVQWAFFILDGAKDLAHSKFWMKIQRPYIGTMSDGDSPDFKDIRNISVIQTVHK